MKLRNVLCMDDEETCHLYEILLSNINERFKIISAVNSEAALDLVKNQSFDLYILQPYRDGIDGIELCKAIRNKDTKTPIVFYSGMSRDVDRSTALSAGANVYLIKGSDLDEFIEAVRTFLN